MAYSRLTAKRRVQGSKEKGPRPLGTCILVGLTEAKFSAQFSPQFNSLRTSRTPSLFPTIVSFSATRPSAYAAAAIAASHCLCQYVSLLIYLFGALSFRPCPGTGAPLVSSYRPFVPIFSFPTKDRLAHKALNTICRPRNSRGQHG